MVHNGFQYMHPKRLIICCALALCACESPTPTCEQRLAAIDTSALTEREYDGPVGESAEGARIVHGVNASGALSQITVTFYGERGRREIIYAIADAETYTMTVNDVAYAQAISPDRPTQDGVVTTHRFALCDGSRVSGPSLSPATDETASFLDRLPEFRGTL